MESLNTVRISVGLVDEKRVELYIAYQKSNPKLKEENLQDYQHRLNADVTDKLTDWFSEIEKIKHTLADRFSKANKGMALK